MHPLRTVVLLAVVALQPGVGSYLDNNIIGTPKVICEENDVTLDIITSKPFEGNIFVKGRAKDSSCRQSYSSNGTNAYSLPLGKCGMQRLRSANPRGINFAVTVVVSFHPDGFITKNDRAFHVKCFYMEPDEIVTNSIQVSNLPTTELDDQMDTMPTCEYSVRSSSVDGPPLSYANVGETVFHVWECKGPDMGMLVKKCFVTDGDGSDHAVVDFDGCSSDASLLSEITYSDSLMRAHAQSQVFKYADSNQLYFTCQIRLCQKQMDMCDGITPPKCDRKDREGRKDTRRRRSVLVKKSHNSTLTKRPMELDVASPEMLVLDRDDRQKVVTTQMCFSKALIPLAPLVLLVVVLVTCTASMLCYRSCLLPPKTGQYFP